MNIPTAGKVAILIFSLYLALSSVVANANDASAVMIDSNPGDLSANLIGETINPNGIVVMLHGCGQNGQGFAQHSGMLNIAKRKNLVLLNIEQSKNNNVQACFNWFSEQDNTEGQGELASIEVFIKRAQDRFPNKPTYLLGLSAGGAMASALLLQKPELFNGAAIVAGVPYPCANNLIQAISCMKNGSSMSSEALAEMLKAQSSVESWPSLLIFTGDSDSIVNAKNSIQMAEQYLALTGTDKSMRDNPQKYTITPKLTETRWSSTNTPSISLFLYQGLDHGIAIDKLEEGQTQVPFYLPTEKGVASIIMDRWF